MKNRHLWFDVRGGDHVIKAILPSPLEGGLESLDCSLNTRPLDGTKEPSQLVVSSRSPLARNAAYLNKHSALFRFEMTPCQPV